MIALNLVYPLYYDGTQCWKTGAEYLQDPWNYLDMMHIFMGYLNIWCQLTLGVTDPITKFVAILVTLICLSKTFFFLRVVMSFSVIVTMIL
jgi:hypothetical protein